MTPTWFQKALAAPGTRYDQALAVDAELELAAQWLADTRFSGAPEPPEPIPPGTPIPLPPPLSAAAWKEYQRDPAAFARRVYRHSRTYGGPYPYAVR